MAHRKPATARGAQIADELQRGMCVCVFVCARYVCVCLWRYVCLCAFVCLRLSVSVHECLNVFSHTYCLYNKPPLKRGIKWVFSFSWERNKRGKAAVPLLSGAWLYDGVYDCCFNADYTVSVFGYLLLTQRNAHKPKRFQAALPAQYRSTQQQDSSEFARWDVIQPFYH